MRRALSALLAVLATLACADPAGPDARDGSSDLTDQLQALTAVLTTAPWQSYAAETQLATAGPIAGLVPGRQGDGHTWSWDSDRGRFAPSELPGAPAGVARFILYPRDSTGTPDHSGNPVGFADLRPLGRDGALGVRVGAGPTRYADYVIAAWDRAGRGSASGVLSDPATTAGFSLRYADGRSSVTLGVPAEDLAVRLTSRTTATGTFLDLVVRTPAETMRGTGRLTGAGLTLSVSRDGRRLGSVELRGDSVSVHAARVPIAQGSRHAAVALARLAPLVALLPHDVRAPVAPLQP